MKKSEKKPNYWPIIIGIVVLLAAYFVFFTGNTSYFDDDSPVMYFWSPTCHYCELQSVILAELAEDGYRVKDMDVAKHREYWTEYMLEGTPTLIAENGDSLVGLTDKEELKQWFDEHGAKIK